MLQKSNQN